LFVEGLSVDSRHGDHPPPTVDSNTELTKDLNDLEAVEVPQNRFTGVFLFATEC